MVGAPGLGVGSAGLNVAISCACHMILVSHLNYDFSCPSCEVSTVAHETVICEVTWNGGLLRAKWARMGLLLAL